MLLIWYLSLAQFGKQSWCCTGLPPYLVVIQDGSPWAGGAPWGSPSWIALSSQAQQETQKAALRYERAVSMHNAAREMVFVAEQGVMADKNRLDPTWQEMLNHATCKVSQSVPTGSATSFAVLSSHHLPSSFLLSSSLQPFLSFDSVSSKTSSFLSALFGLC